MLQGALDCRKWKALGLMPAVDIPEVTTLRTTVEHGRGPAASAYVEARPSRN